MADTSLSLKAAKFMQVPHVDRWLLEMKKDVLLDASLFSIASHSLSTSIWLASIDLTQEMLDEGGKEKLKGKMR